MLSHRELSSPPLGPTNSAIPFTIQRQPLHLPFIIQLQFKAPAFTSSSKPWQAAHATIISLLRASSAEPSTITATEKSSVLKFVLDSTYQTQITPSSAPTATQAEPVLSVSLLVLCRRQICTIRLIPAHHRSTKQLPTTKPASMRPQFRRRCDLRAQPSPTLDLVVVPSSSNVVFEVEMLDCYQGKSTMGNEQS
ncbi:hypothetical protein M0R45_018409 [Rubus argutus]|uniref:Uncharacterized protein n=1 Tax=Rubus argutus TaxID=59490 RepID=A0AAW1X3R8_RUBAR